MDAWIDSFLNNMELIVLFRITLAVALGFVLGIERELYKRPAGLRTHLLVCVASCLVMLVSMYGFESGDPARLASQVVSGIGFLGAGAILRGGKDVKGITTAATIWMSAMLGLACGNGFYFGAILVSVCSIVILTILRRLETKMTVNGKYRSVVYMTIERSERVVSEIERCLKDCKLQASDVELDLVNESNGKLVKVSIVFEKDSSLDGLYKFADMIENILRPVEFKISHE